MTTQEPFSITEKKLVRWAQGLVVFITPEAKRFGWNDKTKLRIIATQDEKGDVIIVRKSK